MGEGFSPDDLEWPDGNVRFESLGYAPGHHLAHCEDPVAAWQNWTRIQGDPRLLFSRPILAKKKTLRLIPSDALFSSQWGLLNTGQNGAEPGVDIRITQVWERFRGAGVAIAVVDDGVEYDHPDLAPNFRADLSHDYLDGDADVRPAAGGVHGTPVSGIVAARANNLIGLAGVAFESQLAGIRLIGAGEGDDQEAASMVHSNQTIAIYNNSWGGSDDGQTLGGLGPLLSKAFESGTSLGRGGRGSVIVWAAGNGGLTQDNVNYDTYANNIHVVAVGAVNDLGQRASYSEPGACLTVSAPGGDVGFRPQAIVTTDLLGDRGSNGAGAADDFSDRDYTRRYKGTSASAPMVSGVAALMLQANPALGWRDVKELLIRSARKIDPLNSDWIENGAGIHFNHNFGAGLLDADAAVTLALGWTNLPPMISVTNSLMFSEPLEIPDNSSSGVERLFDLSALHPRFRVEQATLTVDIAHRARGDLAIRLTSPRGTISRLAERRADMNPDYPNHTFSTVFCWGEDPRGVWKVRIADLRAGGTGAIRSLRLAVHGAELPEPLRQPRVLNPRVDAAGLFSFEVDAGTAGQFQLQASLDAEQWTTLQTTNAPATFTLSDPNSPLIPRRFYRVVRAP